jgi:hypothetical protein
MRLISYLDTLAWVKKMMRKALSKAVWSDISFSNQIEKIWKLSMKYIEMKQK